MELTVEARVMHSVGPVASPLNCRAQVSRKRKASDRALPVRGFLQNRLEEEYGYHDTSDNHRCAAVAQRRLVWPRALVLVSLSTISARSSHWGSVMMGPGSELHLPLKPSAQFGKAARRRPRNWKLCRSRQSTRTRSNVVLTGPRSTH